MDNPFPDYRRKQVYALQCPIDGLYRYVGITTNPHMRLYGHWTSKSTKVPCHDWFTHLRSRGLFPGMRVFIDPAEPEDEPELHRQLVGQGHPILNDFPPNRITNEGVWRLKYTPVTSDPVLNFPEPVYPSQSQTTASRVDAFVRASSNFLETHGFHLRAGNVWSHKTRPEVFENPVEGAYIIWQQEHAKLYPLHTADPETGLVLPQQRTDKYEQHRVGVWELTP